MFTRRACENDETDAVTRGTQLITELKIILKTNVQIGFHLRPENNIGEIIFCL